MTVEAYLGPMLAQVRRLTPSNEILESDVAFVRRGARPQ